MRWSLKRIAVISLGCPKNLVDTERMVGMLRATGDVEFVRNPSDADVIIVNTCGFIKPAKEESIDEILAAVEEKEKDPKKRVVVAGCLYSRYREELRRELPEVDTFIGVDEIESCVERILKRKPKSGKTHLLRDILTPSHIAYLKVSEGCSNNCTYCAIPLIRGRLKSRTIEEVVEEARTLAERGVRELYVIAQDTTAYLHDRGVRDGTVRLLEELERIDGIEWIRLMYTYPSHITDSLIDFIAGSEKVLHYIDVPLQHISDRVLSSMGRRYGEKQARELVEKLRRKIPDIAIRTTFIVGFPSEEKEDFEKLCRFLEEAEFDWAGFFRYSREEGTAAFRLGDLPEELKEERLEFAESIQHSIHERRNERLIGRELELIVDVKSEDMKGYCEARSYRSAYEVDGIVYLRGDFKPGEIVRAEVKGLASSVDLIAEPVGGEQNGG